jgi:hypothetical protein
LGTSSLDCFVAMVRVGLKCFGRVEARDDKT